MRRWLETGINRTSYRVLSAARATSLCAALIAGGCQRSATAPTPPGPSPNVTEIERSGPVRITLSSANVSPGATIAGCGPLVSGCIGRLQISVELAPIFDGPVLYVRAYLHSMRNGVACLTGNTGPFELRSNQRTNVAVTFDSADVCGTPDTMATMDVIVEGPVQTASRQAWAIRYVFAP
jgi:hypothetical protein